MKKIILNAFKTVERKSKLDLINELLLKDVETHEAILLFEKVKANFIFEIKRRERDSAKECRLINSFVLDEVKKKPFDPNFEKPLSEIETNYEIITPKFK